MPKACIFAATSGRDQFPHVAKTIGRHSRVNCLVLSRLHKIVLVPYPDITARVGHVAFEFHPCGSVHALLGTGVALEIIKASPVLDNCSEREAIMA